MDPNPRRPWILAAAAVALLVGGVGFGLAYRSPSAAPPPVVERPVNTPSVGADQPPPSGTSEASSALPDLAGRILADGCRQGECRWSRVVRLESVSRSQQGEFRRLTVRGGFSTYDPMGEAPEVYGPAVRVRWDQSDSNKYAFCSRDRPAFAFPDEEGRYLLHYLDLYDLGGYQLASARAYMRICHDEQFDGDNNALLERLGYRPGTRADQVENGDPQDLTRFESAPLG